MEDICVDPYGIKIMLPKAQPYLVKINSVSNIAANILKQEMLSLGGDTAIARGALTGKTKETGCLLMGNFSQYNNLVQKLKLQPFGLKKISEDLAEALANYQKEKFILNLGKHKLDLSKRTHIMGILNITPDSFSGDGLLNLSKDSIVRYAQKLADDGADVLDVGGESSRPKAKPVSAKEEISRTIPVVKELVKKVNIPVSIDTSKPEVARAALESGASMVNDISGMRDSRMRKLAAKYKAGVVIMHMKGRPANMQRNPNYDCLITDIIQYLEQSVVESIRDGIEKDKIIIDPGIGFGKTIGHNLELLKNLREFKVLGFPILVGTSRKSFIGKMLDAPPKERVFGTVSSCVLAAANGASLVRVHDVKEVKQALRISDAVNGAAKLR
ncbi:MAG: dihydropteroate synthase [Candidatus Omnitrophica bacterium]|nr:dihydropteroate synthase [Candidatus Omnitrophota bacterium]